MIRKDTYLYEVLIRGKADGTIAGAHQITNEVIIDTETGEVLNERAGLATPLVVDDVASVLGEAFATLAADLIAERARAEAAEAELAKLKQAAAAASADAQLARDIVNLTPGVISDRQFAQGLAARGLITRPEALAFVQTGALPALLAAYVDGIADESARFDTKMLLTGAKEFRRDHPLVGSMGVALGFSAADLDAFWTQCAAL